MGGSRGSKISSAYLRIGSWGGRWSVAGSTWCTQWGGARIEGSVPGVVAGNDSVARFQVWAGADMIASVLLLRIYGSMLP